MLREKAAAGDIIIALGRVASEALSTVQSLCSQHYPLPSPPNCIHILHKLFLANEKQTVSNK